MSDLYESGVTGYVILSSTTKLSFKSYDLKMSVNGVDVYNFTSGGCNAVIPGKKKISGSAEGPYNIGNMPIVAGTTYTGAKFGVDPTPTEFACPIYIDDIEVSNDADGGPRVKFNFQSNGSITCAIT